MVNGGDRESRRSLQAETSWPSRREREDDACGVGSNPESRRGTGTPQSAVANPADAQGPALLSRVEVGRGTRTAVRELLEGALADPSSDAYRMREIMCLNELVEAEVKTREMDALQLFRARNQGRDLEMTTARVQNENKLAEAQLEKLRLQIRVLEDRMAEITEKALQAGDAKKAARPFDYERALNQISAVIGLRSGEEFLHDEQKQGQEPQAH